MAFGSQQDVAGQERGPGRGTSHFDFEHNQPESLCRTATGTGDLHGIERDAQPAVPCFII